MLKKDRKMDISKTIFVIVAICLLISNIVFIYLYIKTFEVDEKKLISSTGDEISRVKFFIKDWFDELYQNDNGTLEVYFNELRFNQGKYTLTVVHDRIRAVFPRGIRFFQFSYITYIEFIKLDGNLQCRLYFNETGEYLFKLI